MGSTAAVVAPPALFSSAHVLIPSSTPSVLVVGGASTFTFGLAAGAPTMATGRVGGAMAAHVALSGIAVWVTWPL